MGGHVFEPQGLNTPRMPPDVYREALLWTKNRLEHLFEVVETAPQAPEKRDHGDVDVCVAFWKSQDVCSTWSIRSGLQAITSKQTVNSRTTHYAIPWSVISEDHKLTTTSGEDMWSGFEEGHERFVQLDLQVLPNHDAVEWYVLHEAYSDFWVIFSSIIGPLGLTMNDTGFWLRIPELEVYNKRFGRVQVTDRPLEVLNFLGLNTADFYRGFDTLESLMDYIATCRFYNPERLVDEDEQAKAELKENGIKQATAKDGAATNSTGSRITNRAPRPTVTYWRKNYLPKAISQGRPSGKDSCMTRDEVKNDVFKFGFSIKNSGEGEKSLKERYLERKSEGIRTILADKFWKDLKQCLPHDAQGLNLGLAIKGLKHDIITDVAREKGTSLGTSPDEDECADTVIDKKSTLTNASALQCVQTAYSQGRFGLVKSYALQHWQQALEDEKTRQICSQRLRDKDSKTPTSETNDGNQVLIDEAEVRGERETSIGDSFSTNSPETYTTSDDETICRMKADGATWKEILKAIDKKSVSGVKVRFKGLNKA